MPSPPGPVTQMERAQLESPRLGQTLRAATSGANLSGYECCLTSTPGLASKRMRSSSQPAVDCDVISEDSGDSAEPSEGARSSARSTAPSAAEPDVLYGVSGGVHDDGYADQADEGPTYRSGQNAPARASDTPQPTRPDLSGELGDTAPSSRSAKERALNWSGYCRGMSWSSSLASAVRIP